MIPNFHYNHNLKLHESNISSLDYRHPSIVSGGFDHTIRLWNIESEQCLTALKRLQLHAECIRFNDKRIERSDKKGIMTVWDLNKAFNSQSDACLVTKGT